MTGRLEFVKKTMMRNRYYDPNLINENRTLTNICRNVTLATG